VPYQERAGIKAYYEPTRTSGGPKLLQISGKEVVDSFPLSKEITSLGRIPSNDIVLNISSDSMHHAKIVRFDGNYFLEDLRSTNGTYVNGHRVAKCV